MSSLPGALERLVQDLRFCRGAFTMDYDGLPVEILRPGSTGTDLDAVGAEMATVLREARQAAQDLGLAPLQALSVRSRGPTLIFRDSGRDYLLVAVVDRASSAVAARRTVAEAVRAASTFA